MSVFNEVNFIDKSINSILKQSHHDFEFLIIDDFSNDGTLEKLKFYQSKDSRIKLFFNNERKGLSKNLNFLIKQSKSDLALKQYKKAESKYIDETSKSIISMKIASIGT